MFQFRRFPSYSYVFTVWYPKVGFPIRKSPVLSSFAAPRSLSQLITSFIGSWCQGIPLALFLAWSRRNQSRKFRKPQTAFALVICSLAPLFLLSNQDPHSLGSWFGFEQGEASLPWFQSNQLLRKVQYLVLFTVWIMQALFPEDLFTLNCIYPKYFYFPYCCLLIIAS